MDTSRLLSPGSNVTSPKRRPQIVATRREISETLTAYSEESDDGIKRFFGSRRKHHHRKHMRRAVEKGGHTNVQYKNISKRRRRFISDIYTTMVDAPCVIDLVRSRPRDLSDETLWQRFKDTLSKIKALSDVSGGSSPCSCLP